MATAALSLQFLVVQDHFLNAEIRLAFTNTAAREIESFIFILVSVNVKLFYTYMLFTRLPFH